MLTRKSPSRVRRLAGAAVVALAAAGAGYAAWAAQPAQGAVQDVLITAAAPVLQLAQADDLPAGEPRTIRRVTINKNGVTQTFDGDAIPADIQAEIDAAESDGAHKIVRIIGRGDAAAAELSGEVDVLKEKLAALDGSAHILRIQCTRTDGAEPVCATLEGDPAEAAAAIERLKRGDDADGNAHFIIRREQR